MDALTHHIQGEVPWCMLFADDIVLIDESQASVNERLDVWRQTLEPKRFKLSKTKAEYMECKFSAEPGKMGVDVRLESQKMKVAKMRILRWMCGNTRMDKIRNVDIQEKVLMAPIDDKMREAMLRWFGHVQRRSPDAPVRRCERLVVEGTRRGRERPKKYWGEVIRQDMARLPISEDMTLDKKMWRSSIRVIG
ncbi:uncharacterized protein [Nicotiana sylvestris]|uniref:uncharacterized protein n=1 Tax=Nicotiana sylvestris TaxID=4096 RepID=UPI00388CA2EA